MADVNTLTISDVDYQRIQQIIGYPIVTVEDFQLTDDQAKTQLILPVLRDMYFPKHPIRQRESYSTTTNIEISFPDEFTFGVTNARINTKPWGSATKVSNPIINELNITRRSGFGFGNMWGTDNDYGMRAAKVMEDTERQAFINDDRVSKLYLDYGERKLKGYSNTYGELSVTWAKWSNNFNDVRHQHRDDVIRLAQAYLAEYVGNLLSLGATNAPIELDPGELLSRADNYREQIMEKWGSMESPVILRQ